MTLNNLKSVQKTLGLLLMVFSFSMIAPFIVAGIFNDTYTASSFLASFTFTLIVGLVLWVPSRKIDPEIRLKEGFVIVATFWLDFEKVVYGFRIICWWIFQYACMILSLQNVHLIVVAVMQKRESFFHYRYNL